MEMLVRLERIYIQLSVGYFVSCDGQDDGPIGFGVSGIVRCAQTMVQKKHTQTHRTTRKSNSRATAQQKCSYPQTVCVMFDIFELA